MDNHAITVQWGVSEVFRPTAAVIYHAAFARKLTPLIGDGKSPMAILEQSLNLPLAFSAQSEGRLVGIAGISHAGRKFVEMPHQLLRQHFGWVRGTVRYALFMLFERKPHSGELVMDGIAVDASMRGKGVGTLLLNAIFDFAQAHQYRTIRLDVVDTNPDARRLYERVGFVATKTEQTPFLRSIGFAAVTTMIKAL